MSKYLSFSLVLSAALIVPAPILAVSMAPQKPALPVMHAPAQTTLTLFVTRVRGTVITVKTQDKKTYTLKFAPKASLAAANGKIIPSKELKVGNELRAMGVIKGSTFTASRLRVVANAGSVTAPTQTPAPTTTFTTTQVAAHNSASDCWSIVNGNVYNLTNWINRHPGGSQGILSICGKDGTSAFQGQHGSNTNAKQTLETFKVGMVQK